MIRISNRECVSVSPPGGKCRKFRRADYRDRMDSVLAEVIMPRHGVSRLRLRY